MIRTGSIGLDIALGGGWRPGTLNEVWGDPGAAKTVLALHTAESMTRAGKDTLWIDLNDGVRHMDSAPRVIVGRPRNAEQAFVMAQEACRWADIGLVVFDPAQQLVRQRELDGRARLRAPSAAGVPAGAERPQDGSAADHGTTVLFVSQPRDKEREPVRGTGISEKVSYRVHLHPDVVHQDGTREIVASVRDVPGKTTRHNAAEFTVRPGKGIDQARELVRLAIEPYDVIVRRGSWLAWNNIQEQGVDAFTRAIASNSGLMHDLGNEIRAIAGIS